MRVARMLHLPVILLAIALLPLSAAAKELAVADAFKPELAGVLPKQVRWAPDGKVFYFFDPAAGEKARDLQLFDVETGRRRTLLSQSEFSDARATLTGQAQEGCAGFAFKSFEISPSGRFLQIPAPEGLFLWDLAEKKLSLPLKDPDAGEFRMSPDESKVAFTSKGSLWVLDLKSGAKSCAGKGSGPRVTCGTPDWLYAEELDLEEAFWWSPDGGKIAYLRFDETDVPVYPLVADGEGRATVEEQFYPCPGDPNPRVTLQVFDLAAGTSAPVPGADSGDGYLPRAVWLPGGKAIAFELLDRAQRKLDLFVRHLQEKKTGKILEERDESWVNVLAGPRFLEDGKRFLWLSERDGYTHIYLCDTAGAGATQLTKGSWVVDEILGVDEGQGTVYFSGNREGPTQCHVGSVPLGEGESLKLSRTPGWHGAEFSPDCRHYLDTHSRAGIPGALSLVDVESGRSTIVSVGATPEMREYGLGKPEIVTLKAKDGTTLYASILKPVNFDPKKRYPAVVEVYGGPHAQVVQDRWAGRGAGTDHLFAQAGFVLFSVDGRGSWRRGKAFENALRGRTGKAELEDQLAGLDYLKSLPYVDGSRVGIWGWSYGGFMTLYALSHAPAGAYRCGVAVAPPSDWSLYDSCYTERYLGTPRENPSGYRESSPAFTAPALSGALLLAHGLADDNVHFTNSARMATALYAAGKPFEMAYYPGMGHGIAGKGERTDLFTRLLDFFRRNLAP